MVHIFGHLPICPYTKTLYWMDQISIFFFYSCIPNPLLLQNTFWPYKILINNCTIFPLFALKVPFSNINYAKIANFSHIGEARGCSTNSLMINSVSHWEWAFSSHIFKAPPRPNGESTSSYNIDKVTMILTFLYPKGPQNSFSGSKVTAILPKGWIWPIGGVASGRVCAAGLFIKAWNLVQIWR